MSLSLSDRSLFLFLFLTLNTELYVLVEFGFIYFFPTALLGRIASGGCEEEKRCWNRGRTEAVCGSIVLCENSDGNYLSRQHDVYFFVA
jgi:hypothetical protein